MRARRMTFNLSLAIIIAIMLGAATALWDSPFPSHKQSSEAATRPSLENSAKSAVSKDTPEPELSVVVKVNSHPGIFLGPGDQFTFEWTSRGASYCEMVSPSSSSISVNGKSSEIAPGDPFYPKPHQKMWVKIRCGDAKRFVEDSALVNRV